MSTNPEALYSTRLLSNNCYSQVLLSVSVSLQAVNRKIVWSLWTIRFCPQPVCMPATLQSPGEHQPLDNTMGAILIGILASAVLYGISLVQTFFYYNPERHDLVRLDLVLNCETLFNKLNRSVLAEAIPTGFTGTLVQTFYTIRVWRLSKKNHVLAVVIMSIVLAQTGESSSSKKKFALILIYGKLQHVGLYYMPTFRIDTSQHFTSCRLQLSTFQQLLDISGLTVSINALSSAAGMYFRLSGLIY
ncbi:hypothetical protein F5050DRAFT_1809479 [Lentinula boryana]|uniref:Uncharacterized protein n=1 Tax=Lentinula boryana TaxID=40481 RepID=A0ABQ8Q7S6_9AGAR|nr:hypothetical protein F5050DRAFT_1809479 [Lentinula boryana]